MKEKRKSPVVLRVSALILTSFFSIGAALAQTEAANTFTTSQPQSTVPNAGLGAGKPDFSSTNPTPQKATAEAPAIPAKPVTKSNDNTAKGSGEANDYKQSLNNLAALYEGEVQRLEQRNKQAKELYRDGLIARVEMGKSDKELADARAKVEDAHNQIAAANKPAPVAYAAPANFGASNVAWSTGNSKVDTLVRFYGNKYAVDPYLIFCLMHQESRFTLSATSSKGAQGLMQLMPGTAARYGVTNPYDVAQSIMGGTRYLKDLLEMFNGRIDLALAGYNAGEYAVIKHGYTVPPYQETRNYVRLISARYAKRPPTSLTTPAL